ncbi:MAG: O-antigen ligase family protein [Acidimicrobiales bacterium]
MDVRLASLAVGAQLFFTELDFSAVGLAGAGPDVVKWAVLGPLTLLPALALPMLSSRLSRDLLRSPQGWMSAWLAWSLVTVLWSVDPQQTALQGLAIVGLWVSGFWFVTTYGFAPLGRVVLLSGSAFLALGLVRDLGSSNYSLDGSERFFGISFAATNLARFGLLVLVVAVAVWRDPRSRRLATLAGSLAVVVILGTHTRTVILVILLIAAYLLGRRLGWRIGLLAGATVAIAAVVVISVAGESSVVSRGEGAADIESINGRSTIWEIAVDLARDEPLLGFGTATGESLWVEAANDGEISWFASNSHNLVLELMLTHGLIGTVLFLGGIVAYWRRSGWSRDPMLNAVMIAILATGVTEAVVNRPSTAILLLGGVLAASMTPGPRSARVSDDRLVARP